MHHLIYVSQAEKPMSESELAAILEKSRAYNTRDGITGLLIYRFAPSENHGYFMQMLEGDKDAVRDAFKRISDDKRHHTKVVLEDGAIDRRTFPDWSMGFRNVDDDDLAAFEGYSDIGSPDFWERARSGGLKDALELMQSFYAG